MVNSWSLLYDEMYGPDDEENLSKLIGDPDGGISINGSYEEVGLGTGSYAEFDWKSNNVSIDTSNCPPEIEKPPVHYKYNEEKILEKVKDYIGGTYRSHYAMNSKVQTLDLIDAVGDAPAFCRSNILKYASRYDKKGSMRFDIEKIIHYAVLLYHFEGLDKDSTNGYETF